MWVTPSCCASRHISRVTSHELAPSSTPGSRWQCRSIIVVASPSAALTGAPLACGRPFAEVGVGDADSFFQRDLRAPAETEQFRTVHELARRAVRLAGIQDKFTLEFEHAANGARQLSNREVDAAADIDQ